MKKILLLGLILLIAIPCLAMTFGDRSTEDLLNRAWEKSTRTVKCIEFEHHEMHEGGMYEAFATSGDCDALQQVHLAFVTPPATSGYVHMAADASSDQNAAFFILSAPTAANHSKTTAVTAYNRNRNSSNTSALKNYADNTAGQLSTNLDFLTAHGTTLDFQLLSANKQSTGAEIRAKGEWILAPSTTYDFVLESRTANAVVNLRLLWYEHVDYTE